MKFSRKQRDCISISFSSKEFIYNFPKMMLDSSCMLKIETNRDQTSTWWINEEDTYEFILYNFIEEDYLIYTIEEI